MLVIIKKSVHRKSKKESIFELELTIKKMKADKLDLEKTIKK